MPIKDWSTTAASNATAGSITWAEGQLPSTVNDSARQMMADTRAWTDDGGWHNWGHTHTYSSTTATLVSGDVTAIYPANRSIRAVGSSTGTIYGKVASSSYSAPNTTINYTWDSGSLSNETLAVSVGFITPTGKPIPSSAIRGGGTGDLLAANNLSDVANAATARSNLGLGSAATHAATDFQTAISMATSKLLGRTTAGSGEPEEISVGSGLSLSGGTLSASGGASVLGSAMVSMSAGATVYYSPVDRGGNATEASVQWRAPVAGTISNFYVDLKTAPTAGKSVVTTWRKAGADQALTVTISDSSTQGSDTTHSFTVSAGDVVSISQTLTSGGAADNAYWSAKFTPA